MRVRRVSSTIKVLPYHTVFSYCLIEAPTKQRVDHEMIMRTRTGGKIILRRMDRSDTYERRMSSFKNVLLLRQDSTNIKGRVAAVYAIKSVEQTS